MEVGEIVKSTVVLSAEFGVYLKSNNRDIYVNIPDLDWVKRIPDPREFTKIGDEFDVLLIGQNKDWSYPKKLDTVIL